jgi:hypothetical protein
LSEKPTLTRQLLGGSFPPKRAACTQEVWEYVTALQSLVERYGCITRYPNPSYLGNTAINRYEFAAGLNACLEQINKLITNNTANPVKDENLIELQRLQTHTVS